VYCHCVYTPWTIILYWGTDVNRCTPIWYCYRPLRFKSWKEPAIQVQTLNSLPWDSFLLVVNNINREYSRSVCVRPVRHSKTWAWTEHPSTVKLVGVLQLGVSEWTPKLWHFWGRNSISRKCQWATTLNVRFIVSSGSTDLNWRSQWDLAFQEVKFGLWGFSKFVFSPIE
jgi:hypothetical protein